MTITALMTIFPMLLGITGIAAGQDEPRVRSLIVQDELVLRVPIAPPPPKLEWTEHEGPQCINAQAIQRAFLSGSASVDFVTVRRRRIRAELSQDCPALDYYEGFYLKPEDQRVCAKRDVIRSRIGGSCRIERFKWLVPKPRD